MSPFGLCCFVIMKNANDSCSVSAAACATLARSACMYCACKCSVCACPELELKKKMTRFSRLQSSMHRCSIELKLSNTGLQNNRYDSGLIMDVHSLDDMKQNIFTFNFISIIEEQLWHIRFIWWTSA